MTRVADFRVYQVHEPDWERACVVVARNAMEARRLGSEKLGFDETDLEAHLAPELEGYSGADLIRQQLVTGWWFGCHQRECQKEVRHYESEDNVYVVREGRVFCSSTCALIELRRERWKRAWEWNALRSAVERYPGIQVMSVFENVAGEAIYDVLLPENGHRTVQTLEGCP